MAEADPKCDPAQALSAADEQYRQWLVAAEQKAQEDYDKTVITLSGGALAISFAFVKDILGDGPIKHPGWLVACWGLWALSLASMLASFYYSRKALRKAIEQCDSDTIRCEPPGGFFTSILRWLNALGAVFFVAGVLCMTVFVSINISSREHSRDRQTPPADSTAKPAAAPSAEGLRERSQTEQGLRAAAPAAQEEQVTR
ncbi:hypothetical protein [Pseudoxanthomonas winnipegensis]|uniref:Transmembrane protein n=1 Tax=Pseudoxanthomonas winnipegensis TaxID=2480810 RepID=A0A4Q8LKR0_9GAMM|nr:hypothetical protein [Pseudoxanthomonas winnipegensis]RZZ85025.1 hypothetical protein EA662_11275 [Pseudoxanthomonas winnipegensis]TAA31105.1 hypothetical protein EA661_05855 [Pseudoxanthomonas winnipegensis]TAA38584.1 hypothetical protein EAT51_16520 [Pseudoxanthomonas winnipegensis]TBV77618.1 hypothetical protein EYC46_04785 [Pseudoxanthomonas winnipegensis]